MTDKFTSIPINIKSALQFASDKLKCSETPRLDAEVLLAHLINKDRIYLYLHQEKTIERNTFIRYNQLIERRIKHEPVSYLNGYKEFMSLDFMVDENVLIPRPETEILVETVCKFNDSNVRILDIGTGSGAIAVSLTKYKNPLKVFAVDISPEALEVARKNILAHEVENQVLLMQTSLFDGLKPGIGLDWIVSNPPYISSDDMKNLPDSVKSYEPGIALDGGIDGLLFIKIIISEAYKYLCPGGRLALEIGHGQMEKVREIAIITDKYTDYCSVNDYSGIPRVFHCMRRKHIGNNNG